MLTWFISSHHNYLKFNQKTKQQKLRAKLEITKNFLQSKTLQKYAKQANIIGIILLIIGLKFHGKLLLNLMLKGRDWWPFELVFSITKEPMVRKMKD